MTAPETRWTAETEELVREHAGVYQVDAYEILAALARFGLLLPPGGETVVEASYHVVSAKTGNIVMVEGEHTHRVSVERTRTTWPNGQLLFGPWIEVPS